MHIRYGYGIEIDCAQETPLILRLDIHPDQRADITEPDTFAASEVPTGAPVLAEAPHLDSFGNITRRLVAPTGRLRLEARGKIHHSGFADARREGATQHKVQDLPPEVLPFLNGSRYCETDLLSEAAWSRFGQIDNGWDRVVAVCDFVHRHIRFDYMQARDTRTANEAYREQVGVCRDFTHLAVALCRALNIPARYCNGYLGDIGVPPCPDPMDFSAWFEVYLDDAWWTFDARHNMPRIGRILIARGLDAADVPMISSFGQHVLARFEIITEEVAGDRYPVSSHERRERPTLIVTR